MNDSAKIPLLDALQAEKEEIERKYLAECAVSRELQRSLMLLTSGKGPGLRVLFDEISDRYALLVYDEFVIIDPHSALITIHYVSSTINNRTQIILIFYSNAEAMNRGTDPTTPYANPTTPYARGDEFIAEGPGPGSPNRRGSGIESDMGSRMSVVSRQSSMQGQVQGQVSRRGSKQGPASTQQLYMQGQGQGSRRGSKQGLGSVQQVYQGQGSRRGSKQGLGPEITHGQASYSLSPQRSYTGSGSALEQGSLTPSRQGSSPASRQGSERGLGLLKQVSIMVSGPGSEKGSRQGSYLGSPPGSVGPSRQVSGSFESSGPMSVPALEAALKAALEEGELHGFRSLYSTVFVFV
jgi:hypothetical protein